ncbi:MAG: hypothetical protein PHW53_04125 [Patescibacteria group bacterium]|nr:hypothetical protein [Patescibacteria group bacterium]
MSKHPACPTCGRKLVARFVKCPRCKGKGILGVFDPPCERCNATGWICSVDKTCPACANRKKPKRKNGKKP